MFQFPNGLAVTLRSPDNEVPDPYKDIEVPRPGQVIKLSTSRRLTALLRAAGHRGWCVCVFGVLLSGWDIEGKSVLNC